MLHRPRARRSVDGNEEIERRSKAFVEGLDLPPVDSVFELMPFVEQRTGREIKLMPFSPDLSDPDSLDPSTPCGLWLATDTTDFLFYDEGVSQAYTEIVAGHELAHILKHRDKKESLSGSHLGGLIMDIDSATARLILGRTHYAEPDEFEAEMIGSLMQEHVRRSRVETVRDCEVDDPIARTLLR